MIDREIPDSEVHDAGELAKLSPETITALEMVRSLRRWCIDNRIPFLIAIQSSRYYPIRVSGAGTEKTSISALLDALITEIERRAEPESVGVAA